MALRPRLQPTLETIQEFELAAEERYWAGLELMTRGDALTGIYILGYVAEMLLKNSYFLLSVATRPTFPVGSQLAQAKLAMSILVPQYKFKNYRDARKTPGFSQGDISTTSFLRRSLWACIFLQAVV